MGCLLPSLKTRFFIFTRTLLVLIIVFEVTRRVFDHFENLNECINLERHPGLASKCSYKADARGFHQKVVSFSVFGNLSDKNTMERYLKPLIDTSLSFPFKYPGWVMRIYHNSSLQESRENWEILDNYFGQSSPVRSHVDLCLLNHIKISNLTVEKLNPRTWRFLPLLDELVDIFASRDSDSLIYQRELEVVHEWLESNYTFHVMRDNPYHCGAPMLAGMWGAKLYQNRERIMEYVRRMFPINHPHVNVISYDQDFLKEIIWPLAQESLMSHDSFCCEDEYEYLENSSVVGRLFHSQRKNGEYVGLNLFDKPDTKLFSKECPVKCRPIQNWIYC